MSTPKQNIAFIFASALLATSLTMHVAHADDDEHEERGSRYSQKYGGQKYGGENRSKSLATTQTNAKFQQECTACHIAYAPGLLPAESWRKMMTGLDKHFGSDASLDAQDNKEITAFLIKNSSTRWSAPTAPLRITETAWFKRKHDGHEINPSVWKNPKVKSPANCLACHPQAERGNFNEHDIRIPK